MWDTKISHNYMVNIGNAIFSVNAFAGATIAGEETVIIHLKHTEPMAVTVDHPARYLDQIMYMIREINK